VKTPVQLVGYALITAVVGLWVMPNLVLAQNNQGTYKIGVVDRKKVFDSYEKKKEELAALETQMKEKQAALDSLEQKIEKAQKDLEAKKDNLSEEEREQLERQIQSEVLRYQTEYNRLQRELDAETARVFRKLKKDINEVVHQIGVEQNYHLILDGDPDSSGGVLYFATVIDMTSEVLARLNRAAGQVSR